MSKLEDWKNIEIIEESPPNKLTTLEDILRDYYEKLERFQEIVLFYIYQEAQQPRDKIQNAWLALVVGGRNQVKQLSSKISNKDKEWNHY